MIRDSVIIMLFQKKGHLHMQTDPHWLILFKLHLLFLRFQPKLYKYLQKINILNYLYWLQIPNKQIYLQGLVQITWISLLKKWHFRWFFDIFVQIPKEQASSFKILPNNFHKYYESHDIMGISGCIRKGRCLTSLLFDPRKSNSENKDKCKYTVYDKTIKKK